MAWDLNGSDQYARFSMNATLEGAAGGPMTMLGLVHLDATADGAVIHVLTSGGSPRNFMEIFSTWNYGTSAGARTGPAGTTGAWYLVIISKNTGAVAPEYTLMTLSGGTFGTPVSGTITGGGVTLGDGTAPGAGGIIQVGRWGTSGSEYVDGRIAAAAIWNSYKNQAAREALTTWALVLASSGIQWAARFDTLSSITDATTNGGNETGRFGTSPFTLAADPTSNFFGGGSTVNAVLAATLASPTGTALAVPRHPAQLAATLAGPAGTIVAKPRVPAVLTATLGSPAGTLIAKPRHPAVLAATLSSPGASAQALPRVRAQLAATLAAPVATMLATPSTPTGTVFAVLSAALAPPAAVLAARVSHHAQMLASLASPTGTLVKDVTPYVTAVLTAGTVAQASLSAGARADATLTTGAAAPATLTAATL